MLNAPVCEHNDNNSLEETQAGSHSGGLNCRLILLRHADGRL